MANRAGPNDWLSGAPVDDDGHVAYVLNVNVSNSAGTSAAIGTAAADGTAISVNGLSTNSRGYVFNGSTWDRQRGDTNAASTQPALTANFWSYAAATGGISNTTTAVTVKTAAGANVRNYVETLDLSWDSLGAATEFAIRDGAGGTVLYRCKIPQGSAGRATIKFGTALKGTANTLLEIVTLTATVTGGVFANLQGWTGT